MSVPRDVLDNVITILPAHLARWRGACMWVCHQIVSSVQEQRVVLSLLSRNTLATHVIYELSPLRALWFNPFSTGTDVYIYFVGCIQLQNLVWLLD